MPVPSTHELRFEFTKDPELLRQYYELRARLFTRQWSLKNFAVEEEGFDRSGDTLIVRAADRVIAGARFCVSTPQRRQPLPMEGRDFLLERLLPDLRLSEVGYAEYGRLAIVPEFRSGELSLEMSRRMMQLAFNYDVAFCFWVAPLVVTRSYRRITRSLGLRSQVLTQIHVPDREAYEDHKMYLTVTHVRERKLLETAMRAQRASA